METPLAIGVIEGGTPTELGLARAAARHPGLAVRTVAIDRGSGQQHVLRVASDNVFLPRTRWLELATDHVPLVSRPVQI